MTERQHEEELLSELLDLPEQAQQQQTDDRVAQPILTRREEQELLRAANQIGTPTLAPSDAEHQNEESAPRSFVSDLAGVARKYPVLTVLAAGSIAFLLARRRRR
jgi:hypothetical protein